MHAFAYVKIKFLARSVSIALSLTAHGCGDCPGDGYSFVLLI